MYTLFKNVKIVTKMALLGGAFAIVLMAFGLSTLWAVSSLTALMEAVKDAGHSAERAARMNANMVQIRRRENQVAADPRPEVVAEARRRIAEEVQKFRASYQAVAAVADEQRRALLERLMPAAEAYLGAVERTLAAAQRGDGVAALAALVQNLPAFEAVDRLTDELDAVASRLVDEMAEEARADAATTHLVTLVFVAATLGLAALLVWLIGLRGLASPLSSAIARLRALIDGDTAAPIQGLDRKDEIGDLARAIETFRDLIVRTREAEARERAEAEAKAARAARIAEAVARFEAEAGTVVEAVASAATEMEATATSLATGVDDTLRQTTAVAAAAEQASANVQTVAAAAEELAASIGEITRQATESTRVAQEASAEAARTNATVEALAASAQKIGEVVRLINDIAGQTNLLALNATIEAARAGEAGKGFAVVASEVKNLAGQTAKATDEIAAQIGSVQLETSRSVEAIRAIGAAIERMSAVAASIAAAVEEQGAATAEIARNVQQAAQGTSVVSSSIGAVQRVADDTGRSTGEMRKAASELSANAERLRREVASFIGTVKAA